MKREGRLMFAPNILYFSASYNTNYINICGHEDPLFVNTNLGQGPDFVKLGTRLQSFKINILLYVWKGYLSGGMNIEEFIVSGVMLLCSIFGTKFSNFVICL